MAGRQDAGFLRKHVRSLDCSLARSSTRQAVPGKQKAQRQPNSQILLGDYDYQKKYYQFFRVVCSHIQTTS